MQPIWKDYYFTIPLTSAEFRIRLDNSSGDIIYQGRANARPNEGSIKVKVNDICADYLVNVLPSWGQEFTPMLTARTFVLQYESGGSWTSLTGVTFVNNWSYDYGYLDTRDGYSFPIDPLLDARQHLIASIYSTDYEIPVVIKFQDGTYIEKSVIIHRTADFSEDDFNEDYAIEEGVASDYGVIDVDLSVYSNLASVEIDGRVFQVDNSLCHRYVLYYVNAYGGWDTLLLKGRVRETDTYTRHTMSVEYDNNDVINRGTRNYLNEVVKTYTLQTGWLTDMGASRMHHLLGSSYVYMQDLVTGDIIPLVINDDSCPYKTYGGEGNRMVNYTIEATLAKEMLRR